MFENGKHLDEVPWKKQEVEAEEEYTESITESIGASGLTIEKIREGGCSQFWRISHCNEEYIKC